MMKDLNKDAYATGNNDTDLKLTNKDMEIDFGQEDDGDAPISKKPEKKIDLNTIDQNEVVDIREKEQDKNAKILGDKGKNQQA